MRYLKFTIRNYKAISGPLDIDISKKPLIPIIGINECGKTTILHAIYGFDLFNDKLEANTRHLTDTENLYKSKSPDATVTALIEVSAVELKTHINKSVQDQATARRIYNRLKATFGGQLEIERNLKTRKYRFVTPSIKEDHNFTDAIVTQLIRHLPYILFFDDFRDSVPDEKIEIPQPSAKRPEGWLAIIDKLFKKTNSNYSIFDLPSMDERRRKTTLSEVNVLLDKTLSREWQDFKLEDKDALKVRLEYDVEGKDGEARHYLRFEVTEKDANGAEKFFNVRDRSKGFFWFFNFVLKLQFNPKVIADSDGHEAIYLLDEPGSYLHAAVQKQLCKKIKEISESNKVIFCTHSHYLLDPEIIPLANIRIAQKDDKFNVGLISIFDSKKFFPTSQNAFQPIYDALQLKPFGLDLNNRNIILLEGINDFYAFETFVGPGGKDLAFLPGRSADSLLYFISIMLAWRQKFAVLWDNDEEGRKKKLEAESSFGPELSPKFHLLDLVVGKTKTRLENLFDPTEYAQLIKDLGLPAGAKFDKVMPALYFAKDRSSLMKKMPKTTAVFKANIKKIKFE